MENNNPKTSYDFLKDYLQTNFENLEKEQNGKGSELEPRELLEQNRFLKFLFLLGECPNFTPKDVLSYVCRVIKFSKTIVTYEKQHQNDFERIINYLENL